jgi:hypothetical protein
MQEDTTHADVDGNVAPPNANTGGEPRGERSGRGRRGRRRGRRGGGGSRQGGPGMSAAESGEQAGTPDADAGGYESDSSPEGAPPAAEREPAAPREYHAEPRESSQTHLPLAHFEPAPRPEPAGGEAKPYVVWSSAPDRGPGRSDQE